MLRKKRIFIGIAILIVLIVGLMFSSSPNISGFFAYTNFKGEFSNYISECNSVSQESRFSCYRSGIEKYHKDEPMKFILELKNDNLLTFKGDDASYALFGTNCHTFYHAVGDFIAEHITSSNMSHLYRMCPTACTSGCMMGVYKRYALKNNFPTDLLKSYYDYCRKEERSQCAHEIGHILHDKYTYSVLKLFDEISEKEYGRKIPAYDYVTFKAINLTGPFRECDEILPQEKRDLCYSGTGHNLFIFSEFKGYESTFEECKNIEASETDSCFAFLFFRVGINKGAPRFLMNEFEEGNKACKETINMSGKESLDFHCYTGIGGGIGLYIDSEYRAMEVTEENILQIKKELLNFAKLCEKVEASFIDNCYAGLLGTRFSKLYDELNIYDEKIEILIPELDTGFKVVG